MLGLIIASVICVTIGMATVMNRPSEYVNQLNLTADLMRNGLLFGIFFLLLAITIKMYADTKGTPKDKDGLVG